MKILLPVLAVSANKKNAKTKAPKTSGNRNLARSDTEQCSSQMPRMSNLRGNGRFETSNSGSSGWIKLENYPEDAYCKHVVQADQYCREIKVKLSFNLNQQ